MIYRRYETTGTTGKSAPKTPTGGQLPSGRPPEIPTLAHPDLTSELAAAHAENAQLRERLADRDAVIADLREDREKWRQQAAALLEDKRPKGFLKRLLGR